MRSLLDVNMLLALFDSTHVHHAIASSWWVEHRDGGWASCPLTQNGFIRIISSPRYPRPRTLADALTLLRAQMALPDHAFWPDDLSLVDPAIFDHGRLLGANQITDVYLLALALKNGGRLVTLDRAIPLAAVRGAQARHVMVI